VLSPSPTPASQLLVPRGLAALQQQQQQEQATAPDAIEVSCTAPRTTANALNYFLHHIAIVSTGLVGFQKFILLLPVLHVTTAASSHVAGCLTVVGGCTCHGSV
jgi:hypothetical protein